MILLKGPSPDSDGTAVYIYFSTNRLILLNFTNFFFLWNLRLRTTYIHTYQTLIQVQAQKRRHIKPLFRLEWVLLSRLLLLPQGSGL